MVKFAGGGGGGGAGELSRSAVAAAGTKLLTNRALDDIRAIPGVLAVIPRDYMMGSLIIKYNRLESGANIIGIGTMILVNWAWRPVRAG